MTNNCRCQVLFAIRENRLQLSIQEHLDAWALVFNCLSVFYTFYSLILALVILYTLIMLDNIIQFQTCSS